MVDEGVEADVRAPTEAALAHRAVVLPQEIIHLPCDGNKEIVYVVYSLQRTDITASKMRTSFQES